MPMNRSNYASYQRQRGVFSIMAAGTLAVALLCLVLVVDSGRLYMEKRSLQRVADMAALEASSRGGVCTNDTAQDFANEAAKRNKFAREGSGDIFPIGVQCVDLQTTDGVREVKKEPNPDSPIIQVIAEKTTPASLVIRAGCLFGLCESDEITLRASAVAGKEEPIAVFSVGSRLIRFDNASVLGGVLGLVGLDLNDTAIASYNGVANVKVAPDGLLQELLGVEVFTDMTIAGLKELLSVEKQVSEILHAVVTVAGGDSVLGAHVALLQQLAVDTGLSSLDIYIPLLTQDDGTPGIFAQIIAPDTQDASSALSAQINALSIIETAIGIATHENALSVDELNINLLGLIRAEVKVGVVEPPSIAIGGVGTTAYTAQVRTYIHIENGPLLGGINDLVSLLGIGGLIEVDLPIALDLVTGQGVLEENTCTAAADIGKTGRDHAEIAVSGEIAKLCIGKLRDESKMFSKYASCESYMEGTEYLNILELVKLDRTSGAPLMLPKVLPIAEEDVYLSLDSEDLPLAWSEMQGRTDFDTVGTNSLAVGDLVDDVDDVVDLLLDLLFVGSEVTYDSNDRKRVAEDIWKSATPLGGCDDKACRIAKTEIIEDAVTGSGNDEGILGGLVMGLLDTVGGLLGDIGILEFPNGCTVDGRVLGIPLPPTTTDNGCIRKIESSLPDASIKDNNLGLGILKDLLNALGSKVLSPVFEDILGLHVSEVDVHLQDLNCGRAKLLL